MKLATVILLVASQAFGATYINLDTKATATNLPAYVKLPDGGVKYTQDIKDHAKDGWRIAPDVKPSAGYQIVPPITYKQSTNDALRATAVVTEKADSVISAEQAAAEQAAQDAADKREAARLLGRKALTDKFADSKEAEAIGALYDLMRPKW